MRHIVKLACCLLLAACQAAAPERSVGDRFNEIRTRPPELAMFVPPEDLRSHLRQAVLVAGARRIGHGVAIAHEDDAADLPRAMRERNVLVEINLTSKPVTLSTDDEGVARMSDRKHTTMVTACAGTMLGSATPPQPCAEFLARSEKTRQPWRLEGEFAKFETAVTGAS